MLVHADVLAQPGDPRTQAAHAAHDQVDLHAGLRCLVSSWIIGLSTSAFNLKIRCPGSPLLLLLDFAPDQRLDAATAG